MGSGKSEVSRRLAAHGALVIDADALAREVVARGTDGLRQVIDAFGPDVLTADGDLDRDRLGRIVFADPAARRRLEGITWPLVGARVADVLATAPADVIVVYDVPLLVESGGADSYDVIVVVATDPQTQLDRLETTRGMSRADAQARIAAQAPLADKLAVADFVLHNDGPLESLDSQVQTLWAYLCDRAGQRIPDRPNGRN